MVKVRKFLKPYKDAGAFHALFAPHRFVDDQVFLTKGNQLGVVLAVDGVDYECLTEAILESYTRRAAAAWRSFDESFRLYQYVLKQDQAQVEYDGSYVNQVVGKTVRDRSAYLASKAQGLYSVRLFYAVLFEPHVFSRGHWLSNRNALRAIAGNLQRHRDTLIGNAESFRRNIGDLLGISILSKADAFAFFRLLTNLEPELAAAERLKYDNHVDYYLPSLPLACTRDGIRIGDAQVEVLSLKEPPASTFPNVLRELLALEANFILCTEFKRVLNDKAITTIRAAQNHFHWSQWVA
jgi:hypothetical protein